MDGQSTASGPENEGEEDEANPRGCPAHNGETDGELKGTSGAIWTRMLAWASAPGGLPVVTMHLSLQVLKSKGVYIAEHQPGEAGILCVLTENTSTHTTLPPSRLGLGTGLLERAWPSRCLSEDPSQGPAHESPGQSRSARVGTCRVTLRGWK